MRMNRIISYCCASTWLTVLLLGVMLLAGCTQERWLSGGDDSATVAINLDFPGLALARAGGAITDETIARVRVFAFDRADRGRCRLNQLIDSPTAPFWFELTAGSYDFYFVINEPDNRADAAVGTPENSVLKTVNSFAELQRFSVATAALVGAEGLYVMSGSQTNVTVEANYTRPTADGHYDAMVSYNGLTRVETMNVTVARLAVKVNLKLVKKDTPTTTIPYNDITEVKITGLPAAVPMLANVLSAQPANTEVALTTATIATTPAGATYNGYTAIIPSYLLAQSNNKTQAAILSVLLDGEMAPRSMSIGQDIVPDAADGGTNGVDYNLYRNTVYHILGKVDVGLTLSITVLPWDEHDLSLEVGAFIKVNPAGDWLNVSANVASRQVTITTSGTSGWVASKTGDINVSPMSGTSGTTVTLSWGTNKGVNQSTRTGSVTFSNSDKGVQTTINSSQLGETDRMKIYSYYWATKNVGANQPQEYGNYYSHTENPCPKDWWVPSKTEFSKLVSGGSGNIGDWTSLDGIAGRWYGINPRPGSSGTIFFPAAGWKTPNGNIENRESRGLYWSSTQEGDFVDILSFGSGATDFGFSNPTFILNNNQNVKLSDNKFPVRCITNKPND